MSDDADLNGTRMSPSVADPARHDKAQSNDQGSMVSSGSDKSIAALTKENEFLRSELISVWHTLAQAEQARAKDQEASQQAIADLQEQVDRFQVVTLAQDVSVEKAERALQDLNRSVTQQGKIIQELGKRSTRGHPDPVPAPSVASIPPTTPEPVVPEEMLLSALPTVDINTVPAAALVRGLSLTRPEAEEIIKHRPYKRIGELVSMNVVPKVTFDRIRKQLVISTPSE
jgi:DNA uptake protein ComE-like DNA-binding protein